MATPPKPVKHPMIAAADAFMPAAHRSIPSLGRDFRSKSQPAALRRNCGVSLVEMVIAMGVLTMVSAGLISVTYQVRSTAEQAVYQNTALTLAQGYLEQLRSLDYTTLNAAAETATVLPLINAAGTSVTDESGNPLNSGDWARETVYLDVNAANQPTQPLRFRFRAVLTKLTGSAIGVEITLYYEATHLGGVTRSYTGSLRSVRSSVPTY
jgi:type II secretory pathway pseudopilin PulG